MTHTIKVHEIERDDNIGVTKKEVTGANDLHFDTPTVSFRPKDGSAPSLYVNEVIKHIDNNTIKSLENDGTTQYVQTIKNEWQLKALNLVIFNLKVDNFPDKKNLDTLAQTLYSASDKLLFLPTIKSSLLSDGKKVEMSKVDKYIEMMDTIIKKTNDVGNNKEFVGTIPLIPATPVRKIIEFYKKHEIQTFAIDGCTKDIILNDADLRVVLSAIDGESHSLNDVLIYACNLGYPKIVKNESRADDFLSIFAHVDIFGSMFKGRGGKSKKQPPTPIPKKSKLFSNDSYSYQCTTLAEAREKFGSPMTGDVIKSINKKRQLIETGNVREMVGKEDVKPFLLKKTSVGQTIVNRLESLAKPQKN
jgi:hypothetical protein